MTLLETLIATERFISGFEGDELQEEPVDGMLSDLRGHIEEQVQLLAKFYEVDIEDKDFSFMLNDMIESSEDEKRTADLKLILNYLKKTV